MYCSLEIYLCELQPFLHFLYAGFGTAGLVDFMGLHVVFEGRFEVLHVILDVSSVNVQVWVLGVEVFLLSEGSVTASLYAFRAF